MPYKDSYFTTEDKKNIFLQEWTPDKQPKAIILYVHGLGSHSGRLDHWAERFVNQEIAFAAYDQRGHGKSDVKRGGPTDIQLMIDDVGTIVGLLRSAFPKIPLILYGHSMGGAIVINYMLKKENGVDALIATSPWLKLVKPPSATLIKLIKPLLKIAPGLTLSNGLVAADISRDEREVKKYTEDPLVHDKISIGLFYTTHEAGYNALQKSSQISCPFLLMHGTGDKITSSKASEELVANSGSRANLKLWEGNFHELHHEPNREEIFNYIMGWLKENKLMGKA